MKLPNNDVDLEKIVNKELGLTGTKGSGCVQGDGDGKGRSSANDTYDQLLNDSKYSERPRKTSSFKKQDFVKTAKAAVRFGRVPIMTTYEAGDEHIIVHVRLRDFKRIYRNHLAYTATSED